ncbi:hypothetical protein E4U39_007277, partial [Claviceps sp. Clav50 group G5]
MPFPGYTPPTPLASQLATATPDANGHILLTLKRRQYVLQSDDSQRARSSMIHRYGVTVREYLSDGKL